MDPHENHGRSVSPGKGKEPKLLGPRTLGGSELSCRRIATYEVVVAYYRFLCRAAAEYLVGLSGIRQQTADRWRPRSIRRLSAGLASSPHVFGGGGLATSCIYHFWPPPVNEVLQTRDGTSSALLCHQLIARVRSSR